jgi:predicted phage tail protein
MTNPAIEWRDIKDHRYLFLQFYGHFSTENARHAISTISSMIEKAEKQIHMVWECTHMAGFDKAAREVWQIFMKEIMPKIERIHLVSNKVVIRSGALVVGVFAGIKITTWSTLDEFNKNG